MIRRPVLAPGLRALRHPAGHLQFGFTTEHRVQVPDTPAVRRALAVLDRGEALPDTAEFRRARGLLAPVLRDGDGLFRPGMAPGEVAATTLRHPLTATERLDARQRARIEVRGDLGTDAMPLLADVGLGTASTPNSPTAVLVLSQGEPHREPLDDLVRAGVPHVIVRAVEAALVVGPFVIPGRSACLQCWDLHQQTVDPAYPALLNDALLGVRCDGVPDPVPAALSWIALGWAVADLVRHVEGDLPSTASAVLHLTPEASSFVPRTAPFHPDCSCRWSAGAELFRTSATMGL